MRKIVVLLMVFAAIATAAVAQEVPAPEIELSTWEIIGAFSPILIPLALVALFFIMRRIMLWYWKIDRMERYLLNQCVLLERLVGMVEEQTRTIREVSREPEPKQVDTYPKSSSTAVR